MASALHGRAITALLLAALALLGGIDPQVPPSTREPGRISVDVSLVALNVTVTDQKRRVVAELRKEDFQVFDDGIPQEIQVFSHEDRPVTAGLVVDHSGSMKRKLLEVSAAARAFVAASNPGDQIFAINFNEHVEVGLAPSGPFSPNAAQLGQAISTAPATGRTALYDAVVEALEMLRKGLPDKKVLLVISDGGDNASTHTLDQMLKLAEQSAAIIYCLGVFDAEDPDRNPKVLRRLAEVTGGIAYFPSDLDKVSEICGRIARDIRDQYTLGYSPLKPARPGEYRTIRVIAGAPRHGKLMVRTRTGYRAGAEAPAQ